MAVLSAKNQWDAGGPVIMVQIENGKSVGRGESEAEERGKWLLG